MTSNKGLHNNYTIIWLLSKRSAVHRCRSYKYLSLVGRDSFEKKIPYFYIKIFLIYFLKTLKISALLYNFFSMRHQIMLLTQFKCR